MTVAFTRGDVERMVKTFTVTGATPLVVPAPELTSSSVIDTMVKTVGGTQAALMITTPLPGVSFTVTTSAGNTSTYNYVVL